MIGLICFPWLTSQLAAEPLKIYITVIPRSILIILTIKIVHRRATRSLSFKNVALNRDLQKVKQAQLFSGLMFTRNWTHSRHKTSWIWLEAINWMALLHIKAISRCVHVWWMHLEGKLIWKIVKTNVVN